MVFDLDTMTILNSRQHSYQGMYGVAVSHDGSLAASVSADGKCRVWEIVD